MSFPAKFPGVCKACGERINVGDSIVWKPGMAWHEACDPANKPVDFSGIERFLKAKHAADIAAGWTPPPTPDDADEESASARAAREANESMGIHWAKGRGFYGRGFPAPVC